MAMSKLQRYVYQ